MGQYYWLFGAEGAEGEGAGVGAPVGGAAGGSKGPGVGVGAGAGCGEVSFVLAPAEADAPYLSLISVGRGEPNRDASLSSRSAPWRDYPLGSS
jgi:hypothetical protein